MSETKLEIDKDLEKKRIIIAVISFICTAIFLFTAVSKSRINDPNEKFMMTAKEIQAVCTDMESYTNQGSGETHYNIYVDFEFNGTNYSYIKISDAPSEYSETALGQPLTVYCSPTDPADCRLKQAQKSADPMAVIFFLLTAVSFAIGIVDVRKVLRERRLVKIAQNSPVSENENMGMYDGINGGENTNADNGLNDPMIDYSSQYSNNPMDSVVDPNDVYGYGGGNPMDIPVNPDDIYGGNN